MSRLLEIAYAKINLALHVRRKRADGYHEIETLFAFADDGDLLSAEQANHDSLTIGGEFAEGLTTGSDNLILKALASMRKLSLGLQSEIPPLAIYLEKRLPVAAGIGGGSADAAALIRMVNRHFGILGDSAELAAANRYLGADVAACIVSQTRLGSGVGEHLEKVESDDIQSAPVLLVNPRIPVPTGPIFAKWDGVDRGPLPSGSALDIALNGRNDLELPAISIVPEIRGLLDFLRHQEGAIFARMSGSGATCFAVFASVDTRDAAQRNIGIAYPQYWTMASLFR